jgi:hypothetical protein
MSQMILEYDECCMFLLNIEVFNIMTPDFPYTSENETNCTILYLCMFYLAFYTYNVLFPRKYCIKFVFQFNLRACTNHM